MYYIHAAGTDTLDEMNVREAQCKITHPTKRKCLMMMYSTFDVVRARHAYPQRCSVMLMLPPLPPSLPPPPSSLMMVNSRLDAPGCGVVYYCVLLYSWCVLATSSVP